MASKDIRALHSVDNVLYVGTKEGKIFEAKIGSSGITKKSQGPSIVSNNIKLVVSHVNTDGDETITNLGEGKYLVIFSVPFISYPLKKVSFDVIDSENIHLTVTPEIEYELVKNGNDRMYRCSVVGDFSRFNTPNNFKFYTIEAIDNSNNKLKWSGSMPSFEIRLGYDDKNRGFLEIVKNTEELIDTKMVSVLYQQSIENSKQLNIPRGININDQAVKVTLPSYICSSDNDKSKYVMIHYNTAYGKDIVSVPCHNEDNWFRSMVNYFWGILPSSKTIIENIKIAKEIWFFTKFVIGPV